MDFSVLEVKAPKSLVSLLAAAAHCVAKKSEDSEQRAVRVEVSGRQIVVTANTGRGLWARGVTTCEYQAGPDEAVVLLEPDVVAQIVAAFKGSGASELWVSLGGADGHLLIVDDLPPGLTTSLRVSALSPHSGFNDVDGMLGMIAAREQAPVSNYLVPSRLLTPVLRAARHIALTVHCSMSERDDELGHSPALIVVAGPMVFAVEDVLSGAREMSPHTVLPSVLPVEPRFGEVATKIRRARAAAVKARREASGLRAVSEVES